MPAKRTMPTVSSFLAALPMDRRKEVERVRAVVKRHLPEGYQEAVSGKMLAYVVPLEKHRDTYNGHPLWYAAIASEKSYISLHLMPVYGSPAHAKRLADGFKAAGKKLNMGKACVRFQRADDLALDAIGEIVASIPMDRWIEHAKAARRR
jgi:hypothetical protein